MLKKLVTTILPIVFAVLLALALDAWYDNLKEKKLMDSTLKDIALDISVYAGLGSVYDYNQGLLDSLDLNIERFEANESVNFTFGFGRPEISSLAWQMARENGVATGFGRELYKDIASVYLEFHRLQELWNYHYQFRLSFDPNMSKYTLARHYRKQLASIQNRHKQLVEKSTEFVVKYKEASFMN